MNYPSALEIFSFVTGAFAVWLTVKQNVWNFPIGILNVLAYSVVFFQAQLFADAGLQLVYFVLLVYGWYFWLHGGKSGEALVVTRASRKEMGLVSLAVAVSTLVLWQVLSHWGGSASFWDALTTSISLGAQWLLNRKKLQSWWLWIIVDTIYLPLYIYKELYLTCVLYAIFLALAVKGLREWRKALPVLRVIFVGAESTGKTTMAEILGQHFQTQWVPEYAREHWEKKIAALTPTDPPPAWSDEDFVHIATTQQAREARAAARAKGVLIGDTNAFSTGTWFERYRGFRNPEIDSIGQRDKVDLYLFSRSDAPFVQDGVRDGETIRDWMDNRFLEQIRAGGVPYVSLEGDYAARIKKAIDAVNDLLKAKTKG